MAVHHEQPWHRRENLRPAYAHSFWWFMFGNGGAIAAIFLPVIILVSGVLGPLGVPSWMEDAKHFGWVLGNPLVKLLLLVICFLTFVHSAHRLIAVLVDLGVRLDKRYTGYFFYALAIVLTLLAAGLLFTTP